MAGHLQSVLQERGNAAGVRGWTLFLKYRAAWCSAVPRYSAARCFEQNVAKICVMLLPSYAISRCLRNERKSSATMLWYRCGSGRFAREMAPQAIWAIWPYSGKANAGASGHLDYSAGMEGTWSGSA